MRGARAGSRATYILIILALTNLFAYAARNAFLAVVEELKRVYVIYDAHVGLLATVYILPHAVATLGFGWAGDRVDRRRVIAIGMAIAAVAGALGALGESFLGLAVSRAFVGLGTAAVVPVANSILGQLFEGPQKASRLAIFNLGLFLGGVVGVGAGSGLGFPAVIIALAIPSAALAVVVARLPVPPPAPSLVEHRGRTMGALVREFIADARVLLKIPSLRWVIASTTVMAFAAGGIGAWMYVLLTREKGMSKAQTDLLTLLALCGGLSGIITGAAIADRFCRRVKAGRPWTIVIGMTATAPLAGLSLMLPAGAPLYVVGVASIFFMSWYHAPMAATVDDLAPAGLTVSAQALVIFTMHLLGTAPSTWLVGVISDRSTLTTALWVPTGALVVAAGCMVFAARTFARDRARHGTRAAGSL